MFGVMMSIMIGLVVSLPVVLEGTSPSKEVEGGTAPAAGDLDTANTFWWGGGLGGLYAGAGLGYGYAGIYNPYSYYGGYRYNNKSCLNYILCKN